MKFAASLVLLLMSVGFTTATLTWIIQIPNGKTVFTAGKVNKITWDTIENPALTYPNATWVRVDLRQGPAAIVLQTISNKTSLQSLHYDWNTPTSLKNGSDYFIGLGTSLGDTVFSALFQIVVPPPPPPPVNSSTILPSATSNGTSILTATATNGSFTLTTPAASTSVAQVASEPTSGALPSVGIIKKWEIGMVLGAVLFMMMC